MKDSTGMIHGAAVKDMLCKTYRFMVNHKLDIKNPVQVYRAEVASLGHHSSDTYCQKFVNEIDYIKKIAEQQPITTVQYTRRIFSETDQAWVNVGKQETEVLKTYNESAVKRFIYEWEHKDSSYVIVSIKTINENYLDNQK